MFSFNDGALDDVLHRIGSHRLILLHVSNKCVDQPAHPRCLISTFVVRFLESVITKLASCKISSL